MAADFSDFRGFKLRYHHCRWCRRSDDRSFYRSTLRRNHAHRGSHAVIRRHDFSRNCTRKSFLSVSAFPSTGEHFSYFIWYLFRYFSGKLDSGSCRSCRCLSRFLSENSSHPRASRHYYCHCRRKICRMLPFLLSQMAISFLIICIKHIKVKRNPVFSQIFLYLPKIYQERNDFMKQLSPGTKTYKENQKRYAKYVSSITPSHSLPLNMIKAFLTGGLICAFGQLILNTAMTIGADRETAGNWCSLLLILISVILTGLNLYSKIGKFGGAGGLVPITGFANSVAASAIEYRAEGQVFGIGCKIFTIAGPVILYGILSSWILGLIYFIVHLMEVI